MILDERGIVFKDSKEINLVFGRYLHSEKSMAYEDSLAAFEHTAATKCTPKIIFPSMEAQSLDRFNIIFPESKDASIAYEFKDFKEAFNYMYEKRNDPRIIRYQEKFKGVKLSNIDTSQKIVKALLENANILEKDIMHIDITSSQVVIHLEESPSFDILQAIKHEITILPNDYTCWILDTAIIVDI